MRRGQSRYPPEELRLYNDDVVTDGDIQNLSQASTQEEIDDNYNDKKELRNMQFAETKNFAEENDEELDYDQEQERATITGGGDLLFTR